MDDNVVRESTLKRKVQIKMLLINLITFVNLSKKKKSYLEEKLKQKNKRSTLMNKKNYST